MKGFTLTELLVGMALSGSLFAAALQAYGSAMQNLRSLQAMTELEDRAGFALQALVSDAQLAGYSHRLPGGAPPFPATARCSGRDVTAWATALTAAEFSDNPAGLPCPARGRPADNSDVLIIRHLDPHTVDPVRQAHGWYVDTRSSENGLSSLRRQTLLPDGLVQNQEIMPGVESLLIEPVIVDTQLLALGIRLTIRSPIRETGVSGDGHRRMTAERLVFLRNANNS